MRNTKPLWTIPTDIADIIADDEMWEDDRWSPVLLTLIGGTSYKGRDIPISWQIEFEPTNEAFTAPNEKIAKLGLDASGYGWANVIASVVGKYHPELADELQFGDTDESACVIWVESEQSCKLLMDVVWELVHGSQR